MLSLNFELFTDCYSLIRPWPFCTATSQIELVLYLSFGAGSPVHFLGSASELLGLEGS